MLTMHFEEILRAVVRRSGDHPPSLVLVDTSFDNTYASVDTLETLVNFSTAVNAPTVVSLSPRFFGVDVWADISNLGYLNHELDGQAYAKFRVLKTSPGAA